MTAFVDRAIAKKMVIDSTVNAQIVIVNALAMTEMTINVIKREVPNMKNLMSLLIAGIVLLPTGLVPTKAADPTPRINLTLQEAVANGKTFAYVDLYNQSWSEIKEFKKALERLGYEVNFAGGMGYNGINGALKIEWKS